MWLAGDYLRNYLKRSAQFYWQSRVRNSCEFWRGEVAPIELSDFRLPLFLLLRHPVFHFLHPVIHEP